MSVFLESHWMGESRERVKRKEVSYTGNGKNGLCVYVSKCVFGGGTGITGIISGEPDFHKQIVA